MMKVPTPTKLAFDSLLLAVAVSARAGLGGSPDYGQIKRRQ